MSLVVWLPLTKDLRQQGLLNMAVTNNGATYTATGGKLGGAYSFNGSSRIEATLPTSVSSSIVTLACWVNFSALPSSSAWFNLIQLGKAGGFAASRLSLYYEYGKGINISIDGSSTGANYIAYTFTTNIWYHIACTYDGTIVKVYINGEQVLSKTASKGSYTTAATKIYFGGPTNYYLKGMMNDARYYNHALSEMEVKELAKGLVLHYPLNRNGWGQENLASQYIMPGGNAPGNTTTSGRTNYYGDYGITIPATENADTYFSIWYSEPLESGAVYTLSAEVSGLVGNSYYNFPLFAQNNSSMGIIKFNHNGLNTLTFTMNYTGTIATATINGKTYYRMFMDDIGRTIASGQGAITIKNIKLEKGSIATPWCPNSSDALATTMGFNSTTEYDCSGLCNNGIRTGTFTWTSDTPKYSVSTYFPNTTTTTTFDDKCWITAPFILNNINQLTVSFWFKKEAITRGGLFTTNVATYTGTDLTVDDYDNSVKIRASDGTSVTLGSYDNLIPASAWCHWVVTFDGINVKVYVNSILKNTVSYSATKMLKNITNITLGANKAGGVHRTAKGNYSDFRIYATALSASDVKSLYQNCATIDPDGTIRGQIRS